jgi:cell division protein FtsQ
VRLRRRRPAEEAGETAADATAEPTADVTAESAHLHLAESAHLPPLAGDDGPADTQDDTEDTVPVDTSAVLAPPAEDAPTVVPVAARSTGATVAEDPEETVRAARRRFVRRQWRRRWLAWRRLVIAVLVAGVLAASVWLVFFSPVLAVSGVQVEGTGAIAPSAVRQVADVPRGGPLATADLDAVAARVKDMPAVKDVDVSRAWPDRVRIDVTERQPVAVVVASGQGGSLRATDAEGVLFRSYAVRPRGLPLIRTGRRADTDALAEAATVAGSLPPALAARVADVSVSTVDTIDLRLKSGRRVRWGSADDSVDKARVLAVLLGQKAAFYDVSVPGEPVIRR